MAAEAPTEPSMERTGFGRTVFAFGIFAVFLIVALVASPFAGSQGIDLAVAWTGWWAHLCGEAAFPGDARILDLRLMRTAMAILAGGGLAVTGAAFQAILRNPLVEPSTLGVSSAAAVGAFLATLMDWQLPGFSAVQAAAFFAALIDILLIYGLARAAGRLSLSSLLLSGITLSFMCGAAILVMIHVSDPYKIQVYEVWLLGSVEVVSWSKVAYCLVLVTIGVGVLLTQAQQLNPVALGDDFARGRGVSVERMQGLIFVFGSLVTAGVVSVAGPIAFVGLIVPHFVRRLVGADQRLVLLGSLVCGAGFLVGCDVAVRWIGVLVNEWARARGVGEFAQLPVGVLTALIGGPVFLWVLIRTQRGARG